MKKLVSLMLVLVVCLSLAVTALARDGSLNDFEIEMGVLTRYTGRGGDVTIPGSVNIVGCYAFQNCDGLKSVSLQSSITYIGDYAFQNCKNLQSISIPDSVTRIGDHAFEGCTSLRDVIYGDYSGGSEEQWNAIEIGSGNAALNNATFHYTTAVPAIIPTIGAFNDVKVTDYFSKAVEWAAKQYIAAGTADRQFSPYQTCTTAEILMFLWRTDGEPAPTIVNPFSDLSGGDDFFRGSPVGV